MMYGTTAMRWSIGLVWFLLAVRSAMAAERPVASLPAHLAESGIPTEAEVRLVEGWLKSIATEDGLSPPSQAWFDNWVGSGLPFSFRYDGREFSASAKAWIFHRESVPDKVGVVTQDWVWRHAKSGLKVVWRIKRFLDYPAIDALLTFENAGGSDSPLIWDVKNLDLRLNRMRPGMAYTVHGAHGGRCGLDDLMPFAHVVRVPKPSESHDRPRFHLLRQDAGQLEIDRSILKTPLTIGDQKFEHGIGTHATSLIEIRSSRPIERFSAWVGVDCNERTRGGGGSVTFSVWAGDEVLFQSRVLRGGQAAVRVDVATKGAKTLWLNVDDAGDGISCDHADWANAVVTLDGGTTMRLDEFARVPSGVVQFGSQTQSSTEELPFFDIESSHGRGVMVGLGWTGSWRARFEDHGTHLEVQAGMPVTRFRLHPGEQVRGPRVLLVFWNGQRLHGSNMLRRVLYEHYLPRLPDGRPHEPMVSVNTAFTYHGKGGYLEATTEQKLAALVQPFIDLGIEAFVVDAGYYECKTWGDVFQTKDFSCSNRRFPRGLRPLSDPLRKAGVAFGVWFVPEVFGDMGDHRAREQFLAVADYFVKNHGMTMYRQDGGGVPLGMGLSEMRHIAGLYEMQDQLRLRYPFMLMEGCCGGGRRIDLESLSRFHWHQKSDSWCNTVSDQTGLYGANLYLPGGVINVPTEATDNFGLWSSFAGQLCVAWHPLDKDFPTELAKRQVARYKRVRPLLSGDFYPLTECSLEKPWLAYQFHRSDVGRGFALIFKRADSEGPTFAFAPKGLEPASRYAIACEGSGLKALHTGTELARGIPLTLKKTPEAELVIYEKQP